jgi:hypothetical protein
MINALSAYIILYMITAISSDLYNVKEWIIKSGWLAVPINPDQWSSTEFPLSSIWILYHKYYEPMTHEQCNTEGKLQEIMWGQNTSHFVGSFYYTRKFWSCNLRYQTKNQVTLQITLHIMRNSYTGCTIILLNKNI